MESAQMESLKKIKETEEMEEKIRLKILLKDKECKINNPRLSEENEQQELNDEITNEQEEEEEENRFEKRVQLKTELLEEMLKINQKLRSIPGYNQYFQTWTEVNNMEVGKITKDNIECKKAYQRKTWESIEIISMKTVHYETTVLEKIKSANTLGEKMKYYVETLMDALEIAKKLRENHIVHMDINDSNLLYSTKKGRAILSGWNLAFEMENMNEENWEKYFPNPQLEIHLPWCIDIYLLCEMAQQKEEDLSTAQNFSIQEMKNACSTFVNHPKSVYTKMVSVEKRQEYLIQIQNYYENDAINAEKLMKKCVENMSSWDVYSICIFYLYVAVETKLTNEMEKNEYIKDVINTLKSCLYAMPNARPQIEYLEQRLNPNYTPNAMKTLQPSENQENNENSSDLSPSILVENSPSTSIPGTPINQIEPPIEKIAPVADYQENPNEAAPLFPVPEQGVKNETLSPTTPNEQEQKEQEENPNTPK